MIDLIKGSLERIFGLGFLAGFLAGMAFPVTMIIGLRLGIAVIMVLLAFTTYRSIIPNVTRAILNHKVSKNVSKV